MKVLIQARSTSKRFPNKVMAQFRGKPLIANVIKQVEEATTQYMVIVPKGDKLIDWLKESGVPFYEGQGDENDCLLRYAECANVYRLNGVIRVTADCPIIDPAQIMRVMFLANKGYDFISNCVSECPDGWEVEYMSRRCLDWTHGNATSKEDREHVTTFIKRHLQDFSSKRWSYGLVDCRIPAKLLPKLSIDTKEDLKELEECLK